LNRADGVSVVKSRESEEDAEAGECLQNEGASRGHALEERDRRGGSEKRDQPENEKIYELELQAHSVVDKINAAKCGVERLD